MSNSVHLIKFISSKTKEETTLTFLDKEEATEASIIMRENDIHVADWVECDCCDLHRVQDIADEVNQPIQD